MSKKATKWSQRTEIGSIFISLMIVSLLTFISLGLGLLLGFIYISDIYVVLGTIMGSYFILKREELYKERVRQLLILNFVGGFITALDLSTIVFLLLFSQNILVQDPIQFISKLIVYILITELIIIGPLIGILYSRERTYPSTNSK